MEPGSIVDNSPPPLTHGRVVMSCDVTRDPAAVSRRDKECARVCVCGCVGNTSGDNYYWWERISGGGRDSKLLAVPDPAQG